MASQQHTRIAQYREHVYNLLDPNASDGIGYYANLLIMGLIAANVAAVMLETVDPIQAGYSTELAYFEVVSVAVFTVEYVARIWSGVEQLDTDDWHPVYDRLRSMKEPMLLVDFIAILPYYLTLIGVGVDLRFLRALRLVRLLRLLKLVRYSESMRAFGNAFRNKRDQLIVAFTANLILLVIAASLMFFAESTAQPDDFGSIPETMWWAIVTLTTVGYGDIAPITLLGRVLGGIVAILGIGLFALPASILASGFIEESSYETTYCPDCGHEIDWERDIGTELEYEVGDWIRIDITTGSTLPYDYHGRHGTIVEILNDTNEYRIDLGDETITVTVRDLRSPHLVRSTHPAHDSRVT